MPLGNWEGAGKMIREPGDLPVKVVLLSFGRKEGTNVSIGKKPDFPVRKRVVLICKEQCKKGKIK